MKRNYYLLMFTLVFGVICYDFIAKYGFTYTDEIIAAILLFRLCTCKMIYKELIFFVIIALFYLLHSFIDPHNVKNAIWMDFFIQVKPYIAFYAVYSIDFSISERAANKICKFCSIVPFVLIPFGILYYISPETAIPILHPSRFATMMTVMSVCYLIYSPQERKNIIKAIVLCSIGMLSLRSKAFGFFAAYSTMLLFWNINANKKILSNKNIIFAIILVGVVMYASWDKVNFYFIQGGTQAVDMYARPLLYAKSWEILKDFPFFGTGYGSYATFASSEYYSPLYIQYQLYLSPEIGRGQFISDTFFPVFAQFGFVGIVLFIWFWVRRIKTAYSNYLLTENTVMFKIALLIVIFFFIESTSDSTFTHNRGMAMLMLLAIVLRNNYRDVDRVIC